MKKWKKVEKKLKKNIARGITDPGYRVYNLNSLFDCIEYAFIQAAEMTQVLNSIPWVRCASGNVFCVADISTI